MEAMSATPKAPGRQRETRPAFNQCSSEGEL